ncbi:ArsC family protein [Pseudooceanicola batsensis HTCC2597]|uniref:ArsC family protein n=1 Tax=Pseudooceanicola batsensis (strain ATCC BAA-863 / DSM 15984 / KCTC 12145 / HTCC2597) TaxID=252305 RepID=A3TYY6_PSEBH|nr:ArsC/Spx/MgsR family protein [Pseudooceanicola batsensis]EAQ02804.1 ArsC family protein [Pseudooceanicola batsensis HTCC2597]
MKLYGLKNCDTCRAARKALPAAEFVDVRDSGVEPAVMESALARFGDALVNRRSTTWRTLDEQARALPPAQLLAEHPTLMKRPLIVDGDRMTLGWAADARAELGV